MAVYGSYTNTTYDSSKKQNVIISDKTISLGDGLPWYYKPFVDMLISCELEKGEPKKSEG